MHSKLVNISELRLGLLHSISAALPLRLTAALLLARAAAGPESAALAACRWPRLMRSANIAWDNFAFALRQEVCASQHAIKEYDRTH